MAEIWRPVPSWEHRYEVSDIGRVRSLDSHVKAGRPPYGVAVRKGRMLQQVVKQGRYLAVTFAEGDRREQWLVHDVVTRAFLGAKPDGLHVAHGDGDHANNALTNLRYCTPKENEADKARHGRTARGVRIARAKLTDDAVRFIRSSAADLATLAHHYGVAKNTISAVRTGRTWKHVV